MLAFLIVPTIALAELNPFADTKTFVNEGKYGTILIRENFMWVETGTKAEYTLKYNTDMCFTDCNAGGTAKINKEMKLFENIKFLERTGKSETNINSNKILIQKEETYYTEEKIYEDSFIEEKNGSKTYKPVLKETKQIENKRNVYVEYKGELLPAGEYVWRIEGNIDIGQSVDWIVTSSDIEFREWATWTAANCATGGTVTIVGDDCVNTFTANGTFDLPFTSVVSKVLVVAGGGGGAGSAAGSGGGGGAGGLLYNASYKISLGAYDVVVGVGGIGTSNGSFSKFEALTSVGGGGSGLTAGDSVGQIGGSGSGGGSSGGARAGGAGIAGQGNNGGANVGGAPYPTGGGGGAGAVGADASGTNGGNGGAGVQYDINGSNMYYAGGGGGAVYQSGTPGTGGAGGGGNGGSTGCGTHGVNGTGGGGGSCGSTGDSSVRGGDGVVIFRYPATPLNGVTAIQSQPVNWYNLTGTILDVKCNFTITAEANISNVTLLIKNNSNYVTYTNTDTTPAGLIKVYNKTWSSVDLGTEGYFNWSCSVRGDGNEFDNTDNRTINATISITTIHNYPADNFNSTTLANTFSCNSTSGGVNIDNVTIRVYDNSNTLTYSDTQITGAVTEATTTWSGVALTDGYFNWSCLGASTNPAKKSYTGNRTITVDTQGPYINITSPINNEVFYTNITIGVNYTIQHNGTIPLSSCWYTLDGVNSSFYACGTNETFNTSFGSHVVIAYGNDSLNNLGSSQIINFILGNITVIQSYPKDNYNSTSLTNSFGCNVTSQGITISNATIRVYNESNYLTFSNTNTSGAVYIYNISVANSFPRDGEYNWSCEARGNTNRLSITTNKTFHIDTTPPTILLYEPTNYKMYENNNSYLSLNYLVTHLADSSFNISNCWYTSTLNGGAESNHSFIPCNTNSSYNITTTGGEYLLRVYTNDTFNNINSTSVNVTVVNSSFYSAYNNPVYEYAIETLTQGTFQSNNISTIGTLNYNNVNYSSTKSGNNFSKTLTIPATNVYLNYSFYWQMNYSWNGVNLTTNTALKNQSVWPRILGVCNDTYTAKTLNLTFRDETTLAVMNGTIDSMVIKYISDQKTFVYQNTSLNNLEYDFCLYPSFLPNITATGPIQYSFTGYPQRKTTLFNVTLSNSSITHYDLYLLGSTNGIYSSFQVVTPGTQVIPGAYVTVYRTIGVTNVLVADGFTDSAGMITFWLNPNFDHIVTVSAAGWNTQSVTVRPSQSVYTITMGGSSTTLQFVNLMQGITWSGYPRSGGLENTGVVNFTMYLNPGTNSYVKNCTLILNYPNGTTINKTEGGSSSGCNIGMEINTTAMDKLYGQYLVNINNSIYALERDARWWRFDTNDTLFDGSFRYAINLSINDDIWGSGCDPGWTLNNTDDTCYDSTGNTRTRRDTADYSRIVFFFFVFAIIASVINFYTGYDTAYPGAMLVVFMFSVGLLTFVNGFFGPGWFYLDMFNTTNSIWGWYFDWANNTMFFWFALIISVAYWFTTMRRYQS
jgi:hypothetical protein